jgi:hypothetical protein
MTKLRFAFYGEEEKIVSSRIVFGKNIFFKNFNSHGDSTFLLWLVGWCKKDINP